MEMQSRCGSSSASDGLSRRATLRWIGGGGLAATMALLGPGREGAAASIEENEAIARRLVEALNSRQLDAIDDVIADDVLIHVSLPFLPPEVRGWDENKQHLASIVTAIPDATLTLDEVIAAEDRFALRVTFVGNHSGEVPEIASTGKAVSITGVYLAHVADGKIVEAWLLYTAPPWVQLIGQPQAATENEAVAANEAIGTGLVEALNAGNFDAFAAFLGDEMVIHVTPQPLLPSDVSGRDEVMRYLQLFASALPDGTTTLDDLFATEDGFAIRVTFTGTHTGDASGIAATGKSVTISTLYLARTENGQIIEAWLYYVMSEWADVLIRGGNQDVAVAANEELARRVFAALNARDLDTLQEIISAEVVVHTSLPGPLAIAEPGLAAAAGSLLGIITALPDVQFTLDEVIAGGDRFAARGSLTGTHTGEFGGVAPTGKELTLTGLHHAHVAEGKIVEVWSMYSGPAWVDELVPATSAEAAQATPVSGGPLDEVLALPGVVAALEFAEDGTLGEYRSKIDVPVTEFEQTAELIATANTFLPALLARYNELSSLEWDAPRWLVYSSDAWTAVLAGNRAVLAETAAVDFNQLYGALAGAR